MSTELTSEIGGIVRKLYDKKIEELLKDYLRPAPVRRRHVWEPSPDPRDPYRTYLVVIAEDDHLCRVCKNCGEAVSSMDAASPTRSWFTLDVECPGDIMGYGT